MSATCGIPLHDFTATLTKVPVHQNAKPVRSFDLPDRVGAAVRKYVSLCYGHEDVVKVLHSLPGKAFSRLTVDETAKAVASSFYTVERSLQDMLDEDPNHVLISKIRSSMWRWGYRRAPWNELVDAFNHIRSFDLGVPDFTVTLDHTTGHNERGYSEHSHTFLDGVFGFLVHWKGQHVMTIGFSIVSGRRLLLQQVQLKQPRGNRWLFRLPANRLEFIINRLRSSFPRYQILVADGGDVAKLSLSSYRHALERAQKDVVAYSDRLQRGDANGSESLEQYLDSATKEVGVFEQKIRHLEADLPRLTALYRDSGCYRQGKPLKRNGVTHRHLDLQALAA